MAWVRYDDQFYGHPKVTAVALEDVGAIGLHVLANTWTNAQRQHQGYVPPHQPAALVYDREKAQRYAALLVKHGLWHEVGRLGECAECALEYAGLPFDEGWVFHNAREYRAAGSRGVSGGLSHVSEELSAKRRAAGRKGGLRSAELRRNRTNSSKSKQTVANSSNGDFASECPIRTGTSRTDSSKTKQTQANRTLLDFASECPIPETAAEGASETPSSAPEDDHGLRPAETSDPQTGTNRTKSSTRKQTQANRSKASNLLIPVPDIREVPSYEGTSTAQTASQSVRGTDDEPNAGTIVREWIDHCQQTPPKRVIGHVAKIVKGLLDEGIDPGHIRRGMAQWMAKGYGPTAIPSFVNAAMNATPAAPASAAGRHQPYRNPTDMSAYYEEL